MKANPNIPYKPFGAGSFEGDSTGLPLAVGIALYRLSGANTARVLTKPPRLFCMRCNFEEKCSPSRHALARDKIFAIPES